MCEYIKLAKHICDINASILVHALIQTNHAVHINIDIHKYLGAKIHASTAVNNYPYIQAYVHLNLTSRVEILGFGIGGGTLAVSDNSLPLSSLALFLGGVGGVRAPS
jgi:hypothetical protein